MTDKQRQAPADQIAQRLQELGSLMVELGADMDYLGGGSDGPMTQHAKELIGAGYIAREWAAAIRQQQEEGK